MGTDHDASPTEAMAAIDLPPQARGAQCRGGGAVKSHVTSGIDRSGPRNNRHPLLLHHTLTAPTVDSVLWRISGTPGIAVLQHCCRAHRPRCGQIVRTDV